MSARKPLKGKKVLVTGAGGFIGSHLVERLLDVGAEVRAFLRYTSQRSLGNLAYLSEENLSKMDFYFADVHDYQAVLKASEGCEVVFHLAANIAIPYSYVHPGDTVTTNVLGTYNVLMAAKTLGTKRVLVVSTSEVYGTALTEQISEDHPLQAQSPYSASKIGAEKLAESFHLSFNLPVVVLRPFNTYGPRQSCRAVIPTIIQQLIGGDKVRLGDSTPTRDFNYCTDLAEGMIAAASTKKAVGQVINIGTGTDISVGDVARMIARLMGRQIQILQESRRLRPSRSEVLRLCCDNTKAKSLLGWTPSLSLEEGLRRTIEWFLENSGDPGKDTYSL